MQPINTDIWYGGRFSGCNVITQFYYSGVEIMGQTFSKPAINFFNMPPNDFAPLTHKYIVAVWHIKPKQLA